MKKGQGIFAAGVKILPLTLVLLGACGGGGGGSGSSGGGGSSFKGSAEGLWRGTTSSGRVVTALVSAEKEFWLAYYAQGNSTVLAGVLLGSATFGDGSFSASPVRDFNLEGLGFNDMTVTGNQVEKSSFSGRGQYLSLPNSLAFATTYDASYSQTASVASIVGNYTGYSLFFSALNRYELNVATVSSDGSFDGVSDFGCRYSGTFTPNTHGNYYDTQITFGGSFCTLGTQTLRGIATHDAGTNTLTAFTALNNRSDGFYLSFIKK